MGAGKPISFTPKDKHSHLWPFETRKEERKENWGLVFLVHFSVTVTSLECSREKKKMHSMIKTFPSPAPFFFFLLMFFYQFVQNCTKRVGLLSNSIT